MIYVTFAIVNEFRPYVGLFFTRSRRNLPISQILNWIVQDVTCPPRTVINLSTLLFLSSLLADFFDLPYLLQETFLSLSSPFLPYPIFSLFVFLRRAFCRVQTGQTKEASNVVLSSLSIWVDSVELPLSKVRESNEAINKSTALTGLSTLFVRDDASIEFFSCETKLVSSFLVRLLVSRWMYRLSLLTSRIFFRFLHLVAI